MKQRLASLGAGLTMVALLLAGCATPNDGVFGPANSLGGAESGSPALSIKALPARGPGPLDVEFSLSARQGDGPVSWSLDFGDRSAPAAGTELPANPRHTYRDPGAYVATFKVRGGAGEATTTLSIVVLEGLVSSTAPPSPTQGPEPPSYSPPQSSSSSSGPTSSTAPTSASSTTTPPAEPPSNSSTSSSSSPTETTSQSSSESETPSSSETATTSSSTSEPTASESPTSSETQSSSESTTTAEEPSPSGSESQSSSDPPL